MKKEFDLWLDESGDFNNDSKKVKNGYNPSLIGGVLIEKGKLSESQVKGIIGTETFHCKDMHTSAEIEEQFIRFKKIAEKDLKIVIFNNEECIMILDNNITYQNIMAEGILQLLGHLKTIYVDVKLNIFLDRRRDTTKAEKTYVDVGEYIKKIEEKIVLEDNGISREDFTIRDGSGTSNKDLMIADIVCNTILTRNSKKFSDNGYSEYINKVYNDKDKTIVFTVLQHVLEKEFNKLMGTGRLGEAVAVLCQSDDKKIIAKCMEKVDSSLMEMKSYDIDFHYKFIELFIKYSLDINRNYKRCIILLENLLEYFLPVLRSRAGSGISDRFEMDIKFYMLTLYTHMGDIKNAIKCIENCDKYIASLENNWKTIEYRFQYSNRKIVNRINMFDFGRALQESEELVEKCNNIKEAIELWAEDGAKIKFDELAKALGSQVQIYTFMLREQPGLYEEAVKISDAAIGEFGTEKDIQRQYTYRSQLETEKKEYDNALKYLFKANGLPEDASIKELAVKTEENSSYNHSAYIRLMAEGTLQGWDKSREMYGIISKSRIINDILEKMEKQDEKVIQHPYEIILWKWGSYETENNMLSAGMEKMEKAAMICFQNEELTLHFIGLAILFELYAAALKYSLKNQKGILKKLKKNYNHVYGMELPESMENIFKNINFNDGSWEYFYNLSRKITY